ncbi:MAG TPA: hypothetical protein VF104_13000 [Burkholderiales bacterium]
MIQAVKDMGKLDNTLIIYISGDNGASRPMARTGSTTWWCPRLDAAGPPTARRQTIIFA